MANTSRTTPRLQQPIIGVVGPTASGKTDLAQELAMTLEAEIISADSMQIYRGMNIGTGKIPPEAQKVKHWGIDLCDPGDAYSVAVYQDYARSCMEEIDGRNRRVILCGGTGLYIRAAIDDYDFPHGEQVDNEPRSYYTRIAEEQGAQALWDLLHEQDPASAALLHPNNVRRVVRAFELLHEGTSYATQNRNLQSIPQLVPCVLIGLEVDPKILNMRIDKRVDAMMEHGLVNEVQCLLDQGFREGITAPQAIGYKEIVASLEGDISMEAAVESIKVATHRYAKRQRTWFRKDQRIKWLQADSGDIDSLTQAALQVIASKEEDQVSIYDEKTIS